MKLNAARRAFSLVECLIVCATCALILAVLLPVLARAQSLGKEVISMGNLITLGVAHATYAADWDGRQVTWIDDDISTYGSSPATAFLNYSSVTGTNHPWVWLGAGFSGSMPVVWGYAPPPDGTSTGIPQPIVFAGASPPTFGSFRLPNAKAFHDYVGGRFYEETYYPPTDQAYESVIEYLDDPVEFVNLPLGQTKWSSYCLSAAAMFHPSVMRAPSAGGWQDPWLLPNGFESPALSQAEYPDLKTHMLEHNWVQNAPANACNPAFATGPYNGCTLYFFNHALDSEPVTLFYDGSVRLLPNKEVLAADEQVLKASGGVDGLWSRDTPLGTNGYFGSFSYDGTIVSHHVLTTDGILGRDTISD